MKKYKFFITASLISFQFTSAYAQEIKKQVSEEVVQTVRSDVKEELKSLEQVNLSPSENTQPKTNITQIDTDIKTVENTEPKNSDNQGKEQSSQEEKSNDTPSEDRSLIPDVDPLTLNPKKPVSKEIFDLQVNSNFVLNGMVLIFENNHLLMEKKYLLPILNDLENPVFHTINKKEYFYFPARFVNKINEEQLKIDVELSHEYFKPQSIDLDKHQEIKADPISALFVNYNLNANLDDYKNFAGSFSTGFMHEKNWQIRSNFSMDSDKRFTRGDTSFIYELPSKSRLIVGDTYGNSINNFSSGNFLGARLASPYYAGTIDNKDLLPTVNVQGYSLNPSKLDIFINDRLYQSKDVSAGKFNLDVPLLNEAGLGNVRAVVYDKAGNPIVVEFPFFADGAILKEGTFEYDISAGFMRNADNKWFSYDYTQPIVNALMIYGVNDRWTQQLYFQATKDYQAVSGTANFIPWVGLGKISTSLSLNSNREMMGNIMYSQSFENFSYGINYTSALNSKMFCTAYSYNCIKDSLQLYGGFKLPASLGSLNFTYTQNNNWAANFETLEWKRGKSQVASLSYSKNLIGGLSLNANLSKTKSDALKDGGMSAYIGLSYSFGKGMSGATSISNNGDQNTYQQQLAINENPDKPWLGFGGITTNKTGADGELNTNFFYAANLSKMSYNLNGTHTNSSGVSMSGNVAGSMYFLPKEMKFGLAKEINSGLALVEVQNANGTPIPISYENKLAGFTDQDGFFVVPNISANNVETVAVDVNKMPYNVSLLEHQKSYRIPSNGSAKFIFRARTNPYLVRLYGLPSGYVFKAGDDYYAVGEQGKTTLEVEGHSKIEFAEGQYCEIDFKQTQKYYYCNVPGNELAQLIEAFSKSTSKPERKFELMKRDYTKLMKELGKEVTPEDIETIRKSVFNTEPEETNTNKEE